MSAPRRAFAIEIRLEADDWTTLKLALTDMIATSLYKHPGYNERRQHTARDHGWIMECRNVNLQQTPEGYQARVQDYLDAENEAHR